MDYVFTKQPIESAAQTLGQTLQDHLSRGERVVWLLSGGSSLMLAVQVSGLLKDINTENLYITLTDERYGTVGHANENWQQLLDAGFNITGANLYRPLGGKSRGDTREAFGNWIEEQFKKANYRIGIFGIGPDRHTAGIKPNSPAVMAHKPASDFSSEDFERITITFPVIKQLDEAIVQISGNDKKPVLESLLFSDLPLEIMPAQILKDIPKTTIYSNIRVDKSKPTE